MSDLPLTIRVVERVVDRLRGYTEARAAWSRLMVSLTRGAAARRSVETSVSSPSVRSFWNSFCDHSINRGNRDLEEPIGGSPERTVPPTVSAGRVAANEVTFSIAVV